MTTMATFKDKRVLITGGTGSFGRCMVKKLLTCSECKAVIVFSRDEWKQWKMQMTNPIFKDPRMRYFLGDVRDVSRLLRAFREVDIIIHAAALKQVPAAEYNPTEFVNTNVLGAMNIINAAIDAKVKQVIALSTDKAVNPVNLYGATKLCSDKLFITGNAYVGARGFPTFSVVRYGNVLNSRGSIVALWKEMINKGEKTLPVTDLEMTRFWITVEQSVDFVIKALALARGGEVFVPKIPSMKIIDLACAIAPGVPHQIVGIREGEKLHEVLISQEAARHTIEFNDHFIIVPEIFLNRSSILEKFLAGREGMKPPIGFSYTSNSNPTWLSKEQVHQLLADAR